jgi:hypothetical protein
MSALFILSFFIIHFFFASLDRNSLRSTKNRGILYVTMGKETIELAVKGIALEEETQMPILILKEKDSARLLPIRVGPFEASAIIMQLEGIELPDRSTTHDILAEFFKRHNFHMLCSRYMELWTTSRQRGCCIERGEDLF